LDTQISPSKCAIGSFPASGRTSTRCCERLVALLAEPAQGGGLAARTRRAGGNLIDAGLTIKQIRQTEFTKGGYAYRGRIAEDG